MTVRLPMKTSFLLCLAFAGLATAAHAAGASRAELVPWPAEVTAAEGAFTVQASTPIVVDAADAQAQRTAEYLAALVAATRQLHLKVQRAPARGAAIVLARDAHAPVAAPEGYALDVTDKGIRVTARDEAGLFYGAITAWQLMTPAQGSGEVRVAGVHVRDEPRFAWRGLMLDSARHFWTTDEVRTLIDQMAQHKLNVVHWHLTDDQGWRIEIKKYPELTRIGAWRTPPGAGGQALDDLIRRNPGVRPEKLVSAHIEGDNGEGVRGSAAFLELARDRPAVNALLESIAGKAVAESNLAAKAKVQRQIIRDYRDGTNDRAKAEAWLPGWMAFPPRAVTPNGSFASLVEWQRVEALLPPR